MRDIIDAFAGLLFLAIIFLLGNFSSFRKKATKAVVGGRISGLYLTDAQLIRRNVEDGDAADLLSDEFPLTAEQMFAAIKTIEPNYYVYENSCGRYYSCGVSTTSWAINFSTPEGCLRHAFRAFCHGHFTRKGDRYRFDRDKFIKRELPSNDSSWQGQKRSLEYWNKEMSELESNS